MADAVAAVPVVPVAPPAAPAAPAGTPPASPAAESAAPAAPGAPGRDAQGRFVKADGTPDAAAEAKEQKRLLKLKLEGKDVELPEDEVIARAQKGLFSEQQASKLAKELDVTKKQAAEIQKLFQEAAENPDKLDEIVAQIAKIKGKTSDEFYMERLERAVKAKMEAEEYENLPPEKKELLELRKKVAAQEAKDKADAEARGKAEHQTRVDETKSKVEAGIKHGLEGGPLEGNPVAEQMMLGLVAQAVGLLEAGKIAVMPHPKELAAIIERDVAAMTAGMIKGGGRAKHAGILTDDVIKALIDTVPEAEMPKIHPALRPNRKAPKAPEPVNPDARPPRSAFAETPADLMRALGQRRK